MTSIKTTRYLISALGCGAALTVTCAFAEQVPGAQTEDPARRPVQPAKPPPPDLMRVAPGVSAVAPVMSDRGSTIQVSQFSFSGNAAQSAETLAPLVKSYLGRPLTLTQLNEAADVIQRHYKAKGWFLAQAYIPAQTPSNGVVEIAVLEGSIDTLTVNVAPDAPIRAAYAQRLIAASLRSGQTITENSLEGPLLLLRDLPRVDAKSVINPGTVPGTASITVNLVKDPDASIIGGRIEIDNYGSPSSGARRLGGELDVNNPFGLGDALSLRGFAASEHGNVFGRAGYTVPVGSGGARVGVSAARLDYVLGKSFESIGPNGVANVYSANATYPLLRSRNSNMLAQLLVERKDLEDRTKVPFSSDKQRLTSARLQLSGDVRDQHAGFTQFSISATSGKLREDDPLRVANDELTYRTEGSFAKYLLSVQRLQQLTPGVHALLSVSGQLASKNLTSAEKYSIGGDSTVRAFPVGTLIGDQGYVATAELRWAPAALKSDRLDLAGILFYDVGQVTRNHDNSNALIHVEANKPRVAGYGIGLNLGYGAHFLFKASVAWQAKRLDPTDPAALAAGTGARAWAQASYAF